MAGGVSMYTVAGRKVSSSKLAMATLLGYVAIGYGVSAMGGKKTAEPVDKQIKKLDAEESEFVTSFMNEMHKEEVAAKPAH
ncbi:hypothetical protein RI367_000603 [Sorochytrium milnesiophthora]